MAITHYNVLKAAMMDVSRLNAEVAAAIADGWQPVGAALQAGGSIAQTMVKGAAIGGIDAIESLQARTQATAYTADGAISVTPGVKVVSKISVAAMTLAAPANDGDEIDIIAGTAFAHVITATNLIDDGVTGGAKDTITLGAFVGACVTLQGWNGHWVLKSKTVATIAGA